MISDIHRSNARPDTVPVEVSVGVAAASCVTSDALDRWWRVWLITRQPASGSGGSGIAPYVRTLSVEQVCWKLSPQLDEPTVTISEQLEQFEVGQTGNPMCSLCHRFV